jgi:hypothetical protein
MCDAAHWASVIADDPKNLADINVYVERFVRDNLDHMTARLAGWNLTPQAFAQEMANLSQGNFMYLVHVLPDIREGLLTPDNIDRIQDLPVGLLAYYQRHWRTMRLNDRARFEAIYEPVLRLLATVREPVTIDYIQNLSGLKLMRIREVINTWRPFLNETRVDGEERYRVYHLSFQDFLAEEGVGLKPYHDQIVQKALEKISGFVSRSA